MNCNSLFGYFVFLFRHFRQTKLAQFKLLVDPGVLLPRLVKVDAVWMREKELVLADFFQLALAVLLAAVALLGYLHLGNRRKRTLITMCIMKGSFDGVFEARFCKRSLLRCMNGLN